MAFALGAILAHVLLLPRYAERMMERTAARYGFEVDADEVSMLGPWFRFTDVVACSETCGSDDPVVVKIGLVRVKPDFMALLRGRAKVKVVDVSLVRARVDLSRPEPLLRINRLLGAGTEAGKGGSSGKGAGGTGGLPEIRGDEMDIEVVVSPELSATFTGARVMPGSDGRSLALDLGTTELTGPGLEMRARHVILDVDPTGGRPLVKKVSFVSPSLEIGDRLLDAADPGPVQAVEGDEDGSPLVNAAAEAVSEVDMREVLAALPVPDVEFSGARITLPGEGGKPSLEMSKLKGRISVDGTTGAVRVEARGEAYQGPIVLDVEMDGARILFEADTPYMPARLLTRFVTPPEGIRLENARIMLDGEGTFDRDSGGLVFDGTLGATGITVDSSRVALEPVLDAHLRLDGHVEVDAGKKILVVTGSRLDACGVPVDVTDARVAKLEKGYQITARGRVPHTHCQELFNALPFEMRYALPGFQFDGEWGMGFDVEMDWNRPDDAVLELDVDNRCQVVSGGSLKLDKFGSTFVHQVKDKVGEHRFVMGPGSDSWVNLEDMAEHMPHAIVTCEDGAFYKHKGISMFAIKRAAIKNVKKGYFAFGASTITMQLVKNLFLSRDRTISRKLQEMILTYWVENSMDKDQIIELYLNVVEFGPAIYGIRNASEHYFNKKPAELALLECAYLAKMLPNPVGRYRYYKNGGIDEKWRAVLERVVTKMYTRNYITEEEWKAAMEDDFAFTYPAPGDLLFEDPYVEEPEEPSPLPDFSSG